jgi:predicted GH43/DUF377 family glycosyl hydrolase
MKCCKKGIILIILLLSGVNVFAQKLVKVVRSQAHGLSSELTVMRRDPSDIIKVGNIYFVWYSKRLLEHGTNLFPGDVSAANGYCADIWYATSTDGKNWIEKGVALEKGNVGDWDEQSAFTPNILVWKGKYYLFYTGVPKPFTNLGKRVTKSAIGLAVSDSPDGRWTKLNKPVLLCSDELKNFDSMRVDDACLIVRDGKFYLYYKGRQWDDIPGTTQTGLAIADKPEGPYEKCPMNPVIKAGHEVMAWPLGTGIMAAINMGHKDLRRTLQYAPDGIHFSTVQRMNEYLRGAGFYRSEAFTDSEKGKMPEWGLEIERRENCLPGLVRIDLIWKDENTSHSSIPLQRFQIEYLNCIL